jgi:L-amino acid N-acyltransferase YncA
VPPGQVWGADHLPGHRLMALEGSTVLENEASLALHQRAGFRVVGVRERIGEMDGRWRDVVLLERRSPRI